ncbi:MAG: Fpg/Nei family glycosylase, partial [Microbacteriaceae bacterium]|nr:Fpg/Nei family glycosylase [Microbacteriaceae bacterium]
MPEGDTVWLTARNLNSALAGLVLTGCDVRVPAFATVDLAGETVHEVVSRGKHLL